MAINNCNTISQPSVFHSSCVCYFVWWSFLVIHLCLVFVWASAMLWGAREWNSSKILALLPDTIGFLGSESVAPKKIWASGLIPFKNLFELLMRNQMNHVPAKDRTRTQMCYTKSVPGLGNQKTSQPIKNMQTHQCTLRCPSSHH